MNEEQNNLKSREIGARMRNIRTIHGLRQKQVAEKLSISLSHYSKIEVGLAKASDSFLHKFCSVFGINEHWLKRGEGTPLDDLQVAEAATPYEPLMKHRQEDRDSPQKRENIEQVAEQVIDAVIEALKSTDMASITECAERLDLSWEELLRTILYSRLSGKLQINLTPPTNKG